MEAIEESLGGELTVERVRREMKTLSEGIQAKQTEIQLIVGSRYHELIESADAVLDMCKSCNNLQHILTTEVPPVVADLLQEKRLHSHLRPWREVAAAAIAQQQERQQQPGAFPLTREDVVFMLHAPTRLWEAMDAGRYLAAASTWTTAKDIADKIAEQAASAASTNTSNPALSSGDDSIRDDEEGRVRKWTATQCQVQLVIGNQWACLKDMKSSIISGAHALLADQNVLDVRQHGLALASLARLDDAIASGARETGLVTLFLERRGQWLEALSGEGGGVHGEDKETLSGHVLSKLTRAVQALKRTVLDAHTLFIVGEESGASEEDQALRDLRRAGRIVAEATTAWLGGWLVKVHSQAHRSLKTLKSSSDLARVRKALWQETHASLVGPGLGEDGQREQSGRSPKGVRLWREACRAVIHPESLRQALSKANLPCCWVSTPSLDGATEEKGRSEPGERASSAHAFAHRSRASVLGHVAVVGANDGLDVWASLFSTSFAAMLEDLFQASMTSLYQTWVGKFERILSVVSPSPSSSSSLGQDRRFTAIEMAWAADHLYCCLVKGLRQIHRHARELVQDGDEAAAAALGSSLHAQTLSLLSRLSSFSRSWLQEWDGRCPLSSPSTLNQQSIHQDALSPASLPSSSSLTPPSCPPDMDAVLILARFAWRLLTTAPRTLLSPFSPVEPPIPDPLDASVESSVCNSGSRKNVKESRRRGGGTSGKVRSIDMVQLESAFTIADSRGEGELTPAELQECLDTLGLSQASSSPPSSYPPSSATFAEVALLCYAALDEDQPADPATAYLQDAFGRTFDLGLRAWARHTVRSLGERVLGEGGQGLGLEGAERRNGGMESRDKDSVRSRRPGWAERVLVQEDEEGRPLEDRIWIPTTPSPPLSVFCFSLAAELGRVAQGQDGIKGKSGEGELGGREEDNSEACRLEGQAQHGQGDGASGHSLSSSSFNPFLVTLLESFRRALVQEARRKLEIMYTIAGNAGGKGGLEMKNMVEDDVLQAVFDVNFLRYWFEHECGEISAVSSPSSPTFLNVRAEGTNWLGRTLRTLNDAMDPVNFEAFDPLVKEGVLSYCQGCALIMSHLCSRPGAHARRAMDVGSDIGRTTSLSMSRRSSIEEMLKNDKNVAGYSAQVLPLVPAVPRFTLLPVMVEASTPTAALLSPARVNGKVEPGKENRRSSFTFSDIMDVGGVGVGPNGIGRGKVGAGASAAASVVGSAASNVLSSLFGGGRRGQGIS